ncbi:MAG: protein-glutamate O-methyltransferase CheR [Proteobacteria bacterium]|nr:protein-glutamate O-methyltransferase CheR [Pseudomonadota bacterium]
MDQADVEQLETTLFLEALYRRHGYDFRNYAQASIGRRVRRLMDKTGAASVSHMIPLLLHGDGLLPLVVETLSVNVSEMFRDPEFFALLRNEVIPYLKTFPFIKVWHAGCASGEEVYSLAMVFKEEGFYDRTTIFATDLNPLVVEQAKAGVYSLDSVRSYTANYQQAGGQAAFSDYYMARYGWAVMDASLRENVTFAPHNLATDGVFGEMHLILCRNVLIYFDRSLQNRVLRLFDESLVHGGIMALGSKESLKGSEVAAHFQAVNAKWRIHKKIAGGAPDMVTGDLDGAGPLEAGLEACGE